MSKKTTGSNCFYSLIFCVNNCSNYSMRNIITILKYHNNQKLSNDNYNRYICINKSYTITL